MYFNTSKKKPTENQKLLHLTQWIKTVGTKTILKMGHELKEKNSLCPAQLLYSTIAKK